MRKDSTNTVRPASNRIQAIEPLLSGKEISQDLRRSNRQQLFVKITETISAIGTQYKAKFVEFVIGQPEKEISEQFLFSAPGFPGGHFAVGDIIPVAEHANEIIPTTDRINRRGRIYQEHRRSEYFYAPEIPYNTQQRQALASGFLVANSGAFYNWSGLGEIDSHFDSEYFAASPSNGEFLLREGVVLPPFEYAHIHWTGSIFHGVSNTLFQSSVDTRIPSSEIVVMIANQHGLIMDSQVIERPPMIMDNTEADETHFEHDNEFKFEHQNDKPAHYSLHAVFPGMDMTSDPRKLFRLFMADVSNEQPDQAARFVTHTFRVFIA